jgi:hypothetical protein
VTTVASTATVSTAAAGLLPEMDEDRPSLATRHPRSNAIATRGLVVDAQAGLRVIRVGAKSTHQFGAKGTIPPESRDFFNRDERVR